MSNSVNQNNKVALTGTIVSGPQFSHELVGEKFYQTYISVKRLSGNYDVLPLQISERLMDVTRDYVGSKVRVAGEFRSFNQRDSKKAHLILSVFVTEFEEIAEDDGTNEIQLDGFICKKPVHRTTPMGREITDLCLAVNRPSGRTDYIPCIAWHQNAGFLANLEVGTRIAIKGRIQSRVYTKRLNETETEERVAYEVSIGRSKVMG